MHRIRLSINWGLFWVRNYPVDSSLLLGMTISCLACKVSFWLWQQRWRHEVYFCVVKSRLASGVQRTHQSRELPLLRENFMMAVKVGIKFSPPASNESNAFSTKAWWWSFRYHPFLSHPDPSMESLERKHGWKNQCMDEIRERRVISQLQTLKFRYPASEAKWCQHRA